ncbi:glycosyltransferase [Alsobacter sp. KACC 23698]|uniref:Glycosyltransferase n=1 Tax=Alsobacter sp. KACC 23698 TaxID=3149229 RepID=A0AAU7JJT6_9HYPH
MVLALHREVEMSEPRVGVAPLVSVIIPCFNGAPFVQEAVESVLRQSHPRIEIIVIDDGSTDDSWAVIRAYEDRVTAIRQDNRGLPAARNRGLASAKGDYALFLDCDDVIAPDAVEGLAAAAAGRADVLACCTWRSLVSRQGTWVLAERDATFPLPGPDPLESWLSGEWIPICSILWPMSLLHALGGFDERLAINEDGDLMMRALLDGAGLVVAERGESFYRRHEAFRLSISSDVFSKRRVQSGLCVLEKLEAEIRQRGSLPRYRRALGVAYQKLAARTFVFFPDLARDVLKHGEALAGRRPIAPTRIGRVLVRCLGMERKQRVVEALSSLGVMTKGRRAHLALQDLAKRRQDGVV